MIKKLFLLGLLVFIAFPEEKIKFHEYHLDLWKKEAIPLEFQVYELLKRSPIQKDVNYLAVPWGVLITSNKLHLVSDIKLNGGFAVTRSTRFRELIPILKKIGIDVLFVPHADGQQYDGFKVLPMPHFNLNGSNPAKNKDILYCFIGCDDHSSRTKIFQMKHPKTTVIIKRKGLYYFVDKVKKEKEKKEYQNVLSRSRFSLCPSGYGPGTLRFWESLQAGAIPVVITDNLVLPAGFDWKSCVVQISESNLINLPKILAAIPNKQEIAMRNNCFRAHKLFSGNNLISVIKHYYENKH